MENLSKLNKIFVDGNDNIVLQDVNSQSITINKNNPEELKRFFDRFGGRMSELQSLISSQNENFELLSEFLQEHNKHKEKSVLVAGTGAFNLTPQVYQASLSVGKLIGELELNLIVGGWEGVDYVVAEEFSKIINHTDFALSDKLTQVVSPGREPIFRGGNIETVTSSLMEWISSLNKASVLILIGGEGGTFETYQYALQEKIPCLPLPLTGGDAQKAYSEMLSFIDKNSFLKKNKDDFLMLQSAGYIKNLENILKNL